MNLGLPNGDPMLWIGDHWPVSVVRRAIIWPKDGWFDTLERRWLLLWFCDHLWRGMDWTLLNWTWMLYLDYFGLGPWHWWVMTVDLMDLDLDCICGLDIYLGPLMGMIGPCLYKASLDLHRPLLVPWVGTNIHSVVISLAFGLIIIGESYIGCGLELSW